MHLKGLELFYLFDKSFGHEIRYSAENILDNITQHPDLWRIESTLKECADNEFSTMINLWHTYVQKGIVDKPKKADVEKIWNILEQIVNFCIQYELYYEY